MGWGWIALHRVGFCRSRPCKLSLAVFCWSKNLGEHAEMQCIVRGRQLYLLHYGVPKDIYQGLAKAQEGWEGKPTARRREKPVPSHELLRRLRY